MDTPLPPLLLSNIGACNYTKAFYTSLGADTINIGCAMHGEGQRRTQALPFKIATNFVGEHFVSQLYLVR